MAREKRDRLLCAFGRVFSKKPLQALATVLTGYRDCYCLARPRGSHREQLLASAVFKAYPCFPSTPL